MMMSGLAPAGSPGSRVKGAIPVAGGQRLNKASPSFSCRLKGLRADEQAQAGMVGSARSPVQNTHVRDGCDLTPWFRKSDDGGSLDLTVVDSFSPELADGFGGPAQNVAVDQSKEGKKSGTRQAARSSPFLTLG